MKTKNIFKALALAMLMPAMLLTTACSSDDDAVNTETANHKGYALPVTLDVTRQGDEATTRATFNESTKKLSFSTGDKLFVNGGHATAGLFAGTLDYDSKTGKFSGTILTKEKFTGTADALLSGANKVEATLLPAGFEGYEYISVQENNGYDAKIDNDAAKAIALTKAAAVEQFSFETVGGYNNGFALAPNNAIVSFTISGLTASTNVDVVFIKNNTTYISKSVATNASGTATFAIGLYDGVDLSSFTLMVGGKTITHVSGSKTVSRGHIYNIERSASVVATGHTLSESAVGEIVGSDGLAYDVAYKDNLPSGVDAAGMVAYKSGSSGLVIALYDRGKVDWDTANGANGAFAHTPAVTGQTWKLPSQDEWKQMFSAFGGDEESYTGLNTAITNAGGTELQEVEYWSSTESDPGKGAYLVELFSGGSVSWSTSNESYEYRVRACLAF